MKIQISPEHLTVSHHLLALYGSDDKVIRIQIEPNRNLHGVDEGENYWAAITGRQHGMAGFSALHLAGCFADGERIIALEFDEYGVFKGWH